MLKNSRFVNFAEKKQKIDERKRSLIDNYVAKSKQKLFIV